jgi:acetolactate synthase small subunit
MHWIYLLTADDRPRVQSRILQVFDNQLICVDSFVSVRLGNEIYARVFADTGECEGMRLKALLHRIEDVQAIRAVQAGTEGNNTALYSVLCPQREQASLRNALAALGAAVVLVTPSHITFEASGSDEENAGLREKLNHHWPVEQFG